MDEERLVKMIIRCDVIGKAGREILNVIDGHCEESIRCKMNVCEAKILYA